MAATGGAAEFEDVLCIVASRILPKLDDDELRFLYGVSRTCRRISYAELCRRSGTNTPRLAYTLKGIYSSPTRLNSAEAVVEKHWDHDCLSKVRFAYGNLKTYTWLAETFPESHECINDEDVIPEVFRKACYFGYSDVAKWLHEQYNVTREEVKAIIGYGRDWSDENYMLYAPTLSLVCKEGHLKIAKWLHNTFVMTIEDVLENNCLAFHNACEEGHP